MRVACGWLLGVALLTGCASSAPEPVCDLPVVVPSEAAAVPYGRGVLWRVEREGQRPSHVFGTIHTKDPDFARLAEPVAAQFARARSLAVEVVQRPATAGTYRRAIEIPDGDLEMLIGQERMRQVVDVGARYGMSEGQLQRLKPWVLSVLFGIPPHEARNRRPTLDQALEDSAEAHALPVYGLESIEEQIAAFDDLDLERQIALLKAALAANSGIDCWWEQVVKRLYRMRDTEALYALAATQMADDQVLWHALVVDRNLRMVERMRDRLVEGGAFVAVGAIHLPGEHGILDLLAEQGYEVAPVY